MNSDSSIYQRMAELVAQNDNPMSNNPPLNLRRLFFSRLIAENILLFFLQLIGLSFAGLSLPISVAYGVASAFLFMRGYSILPGIFLGNFLAYYYLTSGFCLSLLGALLDVMQFFLLLYLSYRYIGATIVFFSCKKFMLFFLLIGGLIFIFNFMFIFYYMHAQFNINFIYLFLENGLANLAGLLVFGCAIVTWDLYFSQMDELIKSKLLILCLGYGLLGVFIIALLFSSSDFFIFLLAGFTFLATLSLSFYGGWCGLTAGIFILGLFINLGFYAMTPLFAVHSATMTISIQWFLLLNFSIGLCVIRHQ